MKHLIDSHVQVDHGCVRTCELAGYDSDELIHSVSWFLSLSQICLTLSTVVSDSPFRLFSTLCLSLGFQLPRIAVVSVRIASKSKSPFVFFTGKLACMMKVVGV